MSKDSTIKGFSLENINFIPNVSEVTPFDLRLVIKKIKIKYSPYKISTTLKNMFDSETIAISPAGVLFSSEDFYEKANIMRIWVELPNYWARKSKHVDYRHTAAPTHFQILSRVINCNNNLNQNNLYEVFCENLNIDAIDASILQDYLIASSGVKLA